MTKHCTHCNDLTSVICCYIPICMLCIEDGTQEHDLPYEGETNYSAQYAYACGYHD